MRRFQSSSFRERRPARINGFPGFVVQAQDGLQTLALEPDVDGRIAHIYQVRNPQKLTHLPAVAAELAQRR